MIKITAIVLFKNKSDFKMTENEKNTSIWPAPSRCGKKRNDDDSRPVESIWSQPLKRATARRNRVIVTQKRLKIQPKRKAEKMEINHGTKPIFVRQFMVRNNWT